MVLNTPKLLSAGGQQPAIYDYADVLRQTGYRIVYLASTSGAYFFSPDSSFYSAYISTADGGDPDYRGTTGSGALFLTLDLPFNTPANLKGDLYLNIPTKIIWSPSNISFKISGAIYHYDGTTETQLSTNQASELRKYGTGTNPTTTYSMENLIFPINSLVHFKIGDKLRIKTNFMIMSSDTAYLHPSFLHDPANRLESSNITQFKAYIPYKLDIN